MYQLQRATAASEPPQQRATAASEPPQQPTGSSRGLHHCSPRAGQSTTAAHRLVKKAPPLQPTGSTGWSRRLHHCGPRPGQEGSTTAAHRVVNRQEGSTAAQSAMAAIAAVISQFLGPIDSRAWPCKFKRRCMLFSIFPQSAWLCPALSSVHCSYQTRFRPIRIVGW